MKEDIQVVEGNKLIAQFMGWTSHRSEDAGILGGSIEYWKNPDTGHVGYSHPNQYHTSWDVQAPAWHKLYALFFEKYITDESLFNEAMGLTDNYNTHFNHGNISACFETIIEALTWHNNNTN